MIDNQPRHLVIGARLAPLVAIITLKVSATDTPMHDHNISDMGPEMDKVPWTGDE